MILSSLLVLARSVVFAAIAFRQRSRAMVVAPPHSVRYSIGREETMTTATGALEAELRRRVQGEVRFDAFSKARI